MLCSYNYGKVKPYKLIWDLIVPGFGRYFILIIVSIVDGGAPSIDDMQMSMDISDGSFLHGACLRLLLLTGES